MRTLYLIRHGQPDFPGGKRVCLGSTDMSLSPLGRLQAAMAGAALADREFSLFSSPMDRARETAALIGPFACIEGLEELGAGEWDGLTFEEIRLRWPELYERRKDDLSMPLPGAEDPDRATDRFFRALDQALTQNSADVAVVSHRSIMRLLLNDLPGTETLPKSWDLPYGSISQIEIEDGRMTPVRIGAAPRLELDGELCLRLLSALDTPEDIIAHSKAVAAEAMRIVCELAAAGVELDEGSIYSAAMLHDICRRAPEHAMAGAKLIAGLGYADAAELISQHHDLEEPAVLNEAAVLCMADCLVSGDERVPLSLRFERSLENCSGQEALSAHQRRYEQARAVAAMINSACGKEVV